MQSYSIGALYSGNLLEYAYPEGVAEKDDHGRVYTSTVVTRRLGVDATALACQGRALRLTAADGASLLAAADQGFFQLCGNSVNYIDPQLRISFGPLVLVETL